MANNYYKQRQLSVDGQALVHCADNIQKLEVREAKIRTKKRRLFQDMKDIIDRMILREMSAKREE